MSCGSSAWRKTKMHGKKWKPTTKETLKPSKEFTTSYGLGLKDTLIIAYLGVTWFVLRVVVHIISGVDISLRGQESTQGSNARTVEAGSDTTKQKPQQENS
jgi:hypothetical protein